MEKIGIMTSIDANHGSCVFNISLYNLVKSLNPKNSVQLVDIINSKFQLLELLRSLKLHKKIPFYNLQRAIMLRRYSKSAIPIDSLNSLIGYENTCEELVARKYSTLIVAKVVWDISENSNYSFPNAFWLSDKIHPKKIAYAISGHRTDLEVFRKYKKKVLDILSSYQLIGVRDNMTQTMMEEAGVNKVTSVYRISDPAFLFGPNPIEPEGLLKRYKISPDRPLLGLLYYGKDNISGKICEHYHRKGYQIINFNMYNPYADINIGHLVSPDEWAALFKQLSFCITDRFHGSVFCLREGVPFVAIEPFPPRTLLNSKIYSILQDFGIEELCYQNTYLPEFDPDRFIAVCDQLESSWKSDLSGVIHSRLLVQNQNQRDFLELVRKQIET
jgi:hypothetical protein